MKEKIKVPCDTTICVNPELSKICRRSVSRDLGATSWESMQYNIIVQDKSHKSFITRSRIAVRLLVYTSI